MLLSSLNRLKIYCAGDSDTRLSNSLKNNSILSMWLTAVSSQIEHYLSRKIYLQLYTEFMDITHSKMEYWVSAPPVLSLVDVYEEPRSLWVGYEREIQYPFVHQNKNSVINPFAFSYIGQRTYRVRYFGGMAYHAVNSRYANSSGTGSFVTGSYIRGATSGAIGLLVTSGASAITIEVLYGSFIFGETVQQYADESCSGSASASCTISQYPELWFVSKNCDFVLNKYIKGTLSGAIGQITALNGTPTAWLTFSPVSGTFINDEKVIQYEDAACTNQSYGSSLGVISGGEVSAAIGFVENRALVEAFPEIVIATEMQIRYMRKHMVDFENGASHKDGSTQRLKHDYRNRIEPEVAMLLSPYKLDWSY